MTALVMGTTIATRWFTARRGLALGILSAGSATGQLTSHARGLDSADLWLAHGAAAFRVPDRAARPAGRAALARPTGGCRDRALWRRQGVADSAAADRQRLRCQHRCPSDGLGSLVFWVLTFTFFVCGVSSFGLMPHFVTLCGDFGINPITSTSLLAMIGVFDFIGTLGSGWLSDRYDNRWLLVWYYALRGVSLIWLPFSGFSLIGLSLFADVTGSTSSPPCRPRCGLRRRPSGASRRRWCSAGSLPPISWGQA